LAAPDPDKAWLTARAILVAGDDTAARLDCLRRLTALATADGDMETEQVIADDRPVGDWFGSVGTAPFFSSYRTMVVRNLARVSFDKGYSTWLKDMPETARLVLVVDEETGDDDKQRRLKSATDAWTKAVKEAGGAVLTFDLPKKEIPSLVAARAKEMGLKINKSTSELLVEMVGRRADAAFAELDKLSLMVDEGEAITPDHVRQMVTADPEYNVFRLAQAVIEGSRGEALRQLNAQLGHAKDLTTEALVRVFPVLIRQVKLVWQARASIELGVNFGHPNAALDACLLENPSLKGSPSWSQEQIVRMARKTTFKRLATCYLEVVRAESQLKGQEAGASQMETLEQMVLRMASA
jgi:DNA polymerase III delta subunit